ncbi:hypothetical protein BH10BAC6_BH10BAC6_04250 [soil metagenome]
MKTWFVLLALVALSFASASAQLQLEQHGDDPMARYDDMARRRVQPGQHLPADVRAKAIEHSRGMERSKFGEDLLVAQPEWKQFGPTKIGGRVKSIIIHPTDPNLVYIGTAAGGVWKTTDGGDTWKPMMDDANAIALGSLCFDPTDPTIIYAGTGEQVSGSAGNIFLGCGLLRSTDAGETWHVVGLTDVGSFSRIYAHPKNRDLLMASCMNAGSGVYKSTNRGATWKKMYTGSVADMSINPMDENEWFICTADGILQSVDGGATWVPRNQGIVGTLGRMSIQQSPKNPDYLYCLASVNSLAQILRSTDHGATWTATYTDSRGCFFAGACTAAASQSFYDIYTTAHPTDEKICLAGGIDVWRTVNNGTSWMNTTNSYAGGSVVHPDQHCAAFAPSNPSIVYSGNDGGMFKSSDGGQTWKAINNGLAITQFYSFDIDLTDRYKTYGGTQDNNTLGSSGEDEWRSVVGGDGMVTVLDHDPNTLYGNQPNGAMFRLDLKTGQGKSIVNGIDPADAGLWVAPLELHPIELGLLYHGRRHVYLSLDQGESWKILPTPFVNQVTSIGINPANPDNVWAGTLAGEVAVSADQGETWTKVNQNGLPSLPVADLVGSPTQPNTMWICYSSYGTSNLFKTTDLGKTWISMWQGMPDVPANCLVFHPSDENIMYIGTDVGVFASFDGAKSWVPYGNGLPRSPVLDLKIHKKYNVLRAATHGRSTWEVSISTDKISDPAITAPTGGDVYVSSLSAVVAWNGFTSPVTVEYSVDDGTSWIQIARDVVGDALMWKVPNYPTIWGRIRITSQTTPAQTRTSRTFTISLIDQGSVTARNTVGYVPYGLAWDGKNSLWTTSFYERKLYKINASTLLLEKSIDLPAAAGDSLFTDLTMDREKGQIYVHKMGSSDGSGGVVLVLDTTGAIIRSFPTPSRAYPTGLELVNGNLVAGERDGRRRLYTMSKEDGQLISEVSNPYQYNYGPRCLATDDKGRLFQTCTFFPTSGGALTECYLISFSTSDMSVEKQRIPLITRGQLINARGIEYDRTDGNFWIADFAGNIYKITGFEFVPPTVSGVNDMEREPIAEQLRVAPNPVSSNTMVSLAAARRERIVDITVVDVLGQTVASLHHGYQYADEDLAVRWYASGIPAGTYTILAREGSSLLTSTRVSIMK